MSKIKLNLSSGVSVEKILLNAFVSDQNKYLVFDNEMTGSMGYPIILVSKIVDNKVVKINDQSEWESVKNCLKEIISGNNLEYFAVDPIMNADDVYYTQLTLPVTSFDALKNSYKVEVTNDVSSNVTANVPLMDNMVPNEPVVPNVNPMEQNIDVVPTFNYPNPEINNQTIENEQITNTSITPSEKMPVSNTFEMPTINNPITMDQNNSEINQFTNEYDNPQIPSINPVQANVIPEASIIEPKIETETISPVINDIQNVNPIVEPVEQGIPTTTEKPSDETQSNQDVFASQKEAFMEACSNMFDALVQKFEKELNKNNQN